MEFLKKLKLKYNWRKDIDKEFEVIQILDSHDLKHFINVPLLVQLFDEDTFSSRYVMLLVMLSLLPMISMEMLSRELNI